MSVWKRLANIAKGQVKVWQRGAPAKDAVLDAEIEATARADAAHDEARRTKAEGAARRWEREAAPAGGIRRDPAKEPVPRTDLLPPEPEPQPEPTRRDLAPDVAEPVRIDPTDLAPDPPPAAAPPLDAPLGEAAGRVLGAVDAVLDAAPDPFEATWDLLPPDEATEATDEAPPAEGEIVDADELDRKL